MKIWKPALIFFVIFSVFAGSANAEKILKVKIVVDKQYKNILLEKNINWESHIKKHFERAAINFEKQFMTKFVISEITEWNPDKEIAEIQVLIYDLKQKVSVGNNDLVMGFSGQKLDYGGTAVQSGLDYPQKKYAYILISESSSFLEYTILHEIGHLCGADHTIISSSIMNGFTIIGNTSFDEDNFYKILTSKCNR